MTSQVVHVQSASRQPRTTPPSRSALTFISPLAGWPECRRGPDDSLVGTAGRERPASRPDAQPLPDTIMRLSFARTLSLVTVLGALAAVPSFAGAQATASICKDGTPSAASGRGACAGHGGVDAAATKASKAKARADAKAAKAAEKSAAKAEKQQAKETRAASARASVACADGTTGTAGRGACSRHGGIAGSTATPAPAPEATRPMAAPARASTRARSSSAPAAASSGAKEDNDPTNALAQCNDGMYSHATNRRGACSRHGGVKSWMHG